MPGLVPGIGDLIKAQQAGIKAQLRDFPVSR
jgi:hypothetical protein